MGSRVSRERRSSSTARSTRLAQDAAETGVEFVAQLGRRGAGRRRQRPDHEHRPGRELAESRHEKMTQPAAHPVADHGTPHGLAHHQPGARDAAV